MIQTQTSGIRPHFVFLTAYLACHSVEEAVALAVDALRAGGLPAIATWSIPAGSPNVLAAERGYPAEIPSDTVIATFNLTNGDIGNVYQPYGEMHWAIEIRPSIRSNPARHLSEALAEQTQMCRRLMQEATFLSAQSSWRGAGALYLPEVPLVGTRTQLLTVRAAEVEDAYDDPEVFWQAWSTRETIGDAVLLLRAAQAETSVQFLQAVQAQQWAMARAAKVGTIRIFDPQVDPTEQALYESGEQTLFEVGYIPVDKVFELACALTPPHHIHGWEIYRLRGLIDAGAAIRVVFAFEAMARAERNPLLTIGARILYYDAAGELKPLET